MLNRSRSSSSSTNNPASSETPNLRSSRDYGSYEPNHYESNFGQLVPYGSQSSRANPDSSSWGSIDEPRSFGRRTTSFGSAIFPTRHRPPVQIIIFDRQPAREPNPQPRRALPSPRVVEERHHYPPRYAGGEQQNRALESLRKEFYNPSTKRITNTVNLYYRDTPVDPREVAAAEENGGKRCAVCLEDLERGQEVMVTPCKHVFHEDCIVPWAKTNAQCPVCRFAFGPKPPESPSPAPANGYFHTIRSSAAANVAGPAGLTTQEFLSILRALGEGFQL